MSSKILLGSMLSFVVATAAMAVSAEELGRARRLLESEAWEEARQVLTASRHNPATRGESLVLLTWLGHEMGEDEQAVEYGNAGIRVNAIAPGPVETEMAKKVHTPAIRADYHDTIPLARYGSLEEIAHAVGFLCSPQASYVNGQVLAVDGGFDAAGVGLPTLRKPQP